MKYKKDIMLASEDASISEAVVRIFEPIYRNVRESLQYDRQSGLMAHCLDISRDPFNESVRNYRAYAVWDLLVDDTATMRVQLPFPLDDCGVVNSATPYGLAKHREAIIEEMRQFIREPRFFTDKAKVRLIDFDRTHTYSNDAYAKWTDYMKPVSCIMSLCDMLKIPKPDTKTTNEMLAQIPDILKGFDYTCSWVDGDISQIYNYESCNQFNSCMAGKCADRFALYDDLQQHGKLRMIEILRGDDEHCGRALVWCGSNPDDMYLDRIYAYIQNGHKAPAALAAVKEFCAEHGIHKCVHDSVVGDIGLEFRNLAMSVPFDLRRYDEYPYVDSMRYAYTNDVLRNRCRSDAGDYLSFTMDQTDGSITDEDSEDYVTLSCGSRVPEEEATYIERHGEYFHNSDCVYTHDDEHELREDCTELSTDYYGHGVWAHDENCTYFHDLGESYHNDDIVEIGDGSSRNGEGGYWPTHLTIETPDGLHWLPTDEGVVEVDGVWQYREEIETTEEPVQI